MAHIAQSIVVKIVKRGLLSMSLVLLAAGLLNIVAGASNLDPPQTLWGGMTLDSTSAASGTALTALVEGTDVATTTMMTQGYVIDLPGDDPALPGIQGGTPGDLVSFALNGYEIAETTTWTSGPANLDLSNAPFTYTKTLTVSGTLSHSFPAHDGTPAITLQAQGQDLGPTAIEIRANQDCTDVAGEAIRRCFAITPTATLTQSATITFYFYDNQIPPGESCTSVNAYRWEGNGWSAPLTLDTGFGTEGRSCMTAPYTQPHGLRVTNVDALGHFVLRSTTPTAVDRHTLSAHTSSGAAILGPGLGLILLLGVYVATLTHRGRITFPIRK